MSMDCPTVRSTVFLVLLDITGNNGADTLVIVRELCAINVGVRCGACQDHLTDEGLPWRGAAIWLNDDAVDKVV